MESRLSYAFSSSLALPSTISHRHCGLHVTSRRPDRLAVRLITATASPSDSDSRTAAALSALQKERGNVSPALDLSRLDATTQRGLFLRAQDAPVLKKTELLTVPSALLLTPRVSRASLSAALPAAVGKLVDELPDEAALALAILHERARVDRTPLAQLVDALPSSRDALGVAQWSVEDMRHLRGSPLCSRASLVREQVAAEFEGIVKAFEDVGCMKDVRDWLLADDYAWAVAAVDARCVRVSQAEPLVLAPLIHTCAGAIADVASPSAHVEFVGGLFAKKKVALLLDTNVPADGGDGVEVTLECAQTYNAEMLLERGEVMRDARAHLVDLTFDIAPLDPFFADKTNVLEREGLHTSANFFLGCANSKGKWDAPESMDAFLRLLCLSSGDAFLLERVFRNDVWSFMQLPVSANNEQAVCDLVIGACDDALDAYGEPHRDEPDAGHIGILRRELARFVVEGEKSALVAAKARYERTAKSLDVLEYYAERRLKALDLLRPLDESEIVDSESGAQLGRAFDDNYR